ncbi:MULTISPECIES: site-specific integrase [Agrobacterium tumefaciens complex]|uniref:Site-specific integrase n=1 Tax=Agrobacterium radiobacter TaxID=362 RepID=A0ABD5LT31_AGRRD|nr:site-specific integrase [Agrobacterium tumefaciens]NSZ68682.1 site-specific integrase [Agrobacterium tumefaciens]OMP69870.1 integrase [Agrobacterium tumefaciens]
MGTITARKRKDGSVGYTAQILRKKGGRIVFREAKTFDRKREAEAWVRFRETEIDKPGALERLNANRVTLADAIDRYVKEKGTMGATKDQVLRTIKTFKLATMDCADIRSDDIVTFANELAEGRKPQTVGSYISHLSSIFSIARPAWGMQLDPVVIRDAQTVLRKLNTIANSESRTRRPTLAELDKIMEYFTKRNQATPHVSRMDRVVAFAIYSTRRQEEIVRIEWEDLDEVHSRILVRDLKHPGQKKGNDVWCELPPEAMQIIKAMPKNGPRIFPYGTAGVGAAFTRACQFLEIKDLHFHDLRHEGISRLFEMGRTIPLAASVSGHRTWNSLKRYTQIRERGDKFEGWKWLKTVTES